MVNSKSCRFGFIKAQLGDHRFADFELLDFTGHGLREFRDEFDIPRHLIMGQTITAELFHFFVRQS